ncbi:MAG: flagellin [Spirochaetes bacterium]|nr:flagellin [Spirochaetota bacterium]
MIINHNMSSVNSSRQLAAREGDINSNMAKLSSGMRINRSGDDASGLAVSEKMRGQIRGLNQAVRNASNGISFIQATEGYLQQTQDILGRVRELAVQSGNGIYTSEDRNMIKVEVDQLVAEIDRIASHAQFNGMNMLQGAFAKGTGESKPGQEMFFQIGANMDQRIRAYVGTMTTKSLGVTDVSISTAEAANKAIGAVDSALRKVSQQRADLGAYQNRMESMVKGLAVASENLTSAESLIRDSNIASEMVDLTKNQILQQANIAMLVQANQKNQGVLRLLGG